MMICQECLSVFDKPIMSAESDGLDSPPYRYTAVCPFCFSNNIDDRTVCDVCGEIIYSPHKVFFTNECLCDTCSREKEIRE